MKLLLVVLSLFAGVSAFTTAPRLSIASGISYRVASSATESSAVRRHSVSVERRRVFQHYASEEGVSLSESDQTVLGLLGTISSLIVFVSEYVLKTTGCGLPAGPFGLFGLAEGLSYLGVVGIAGFSAYTKVKTGSGLPAGPGGLLGAAEGLSFLAIVAGLVVLGFQVANYGYVPNAVPMEGAMCS